jgi:hypothetical protein
MPRLVWFDVYGECGDRVLEGQLEFQCDAVVDLYERNYQGDIRMASARKLAVYIRTVQTQDHFVELGTVLVVEIVDDMRKFFELTDEKKKGQALSWLHSGCLAAANRFGWPSEPFERARQAVIDADFENKWVHRHRASRRDRRYRAELHCESTLTEFRSELVVVARDGRVVGRFPDLVKPPSRMIYGWNLGKLKWISGTEVEILDTQGSGRRVIDVGRVVEQIAS